jgi:hypothetical protein
MRERFSGPRPYPLYVSSVGLFDMKSQELPNEFVLPPIFVALLKQSDWKAVSAFGSHERSRDQPCVR